MSKMGNATLYALIKKLRAAGCKCQLEDWALECGVHHPKCVLAVVERR